MRRTIFCITTLLLYICAARCEPTPAPRDGVALAASRTVRLLEHRGVLHVRPATQQAWIDPILWVTMDAFHKETVTRMIAYYCNPGYPSITILDKQSARELASYGPWQGFKAR